MSITQSDIERDLLRLGVLRGSVLFVHSSFKSLGKVDGGAATIIAAIETVLGDEGTLLMPSFNMASRDPAERAAQWNIETTPSSVGYLTEYFRCMSGTLRSDHYSHSVAVRGANAAWFTNGHGAQDGWISPWDRLPWGRTYGTHSPMLRALHAGAKVLLLGVDYGCLTYTHVAEVSDYNRRLADDPDAAYYFTNRVGVGEWWQAHGNITSGFIGEAACQLFDARSCVDMLACELKARPSKFYPSWT